MSNPFSYAELHTSDRARAVDFYKRLFDWKTKESETPMGPYVEIDAGEGFPGGLLAAQGSAPSRWVVYMRVDDVRAATRRAEELGAKILANAEKVPDAGTFSLCVDPTGATFGLWEPLARKP
jgi:predicted enzyme related to lactoylglutathione lyase